MTTWGRWAVVALVGAVLVGLPVAVRSLPVDDADLDAADLLDLVRSADDLPYSGYAESVGSLQVPDVDDFGTVADLFGERSRLRVWWRADDDWRVDRIRATGETDLVRDERGLATWSYESLDVTFTPPPGVRLPDGSDLLPPRLAAYVLQGATDEEVTRIGAERVAGRTALGLRLDPDDDRSSIDHVDVWADEETGLPLAVDVVAVGDDRPVVSTELLDVDLDLPDASTTRFRPPPGADVDVEDAADLAAAADAFAPVLAPATLLGLPARSTADDGEVRAVGVYGRGPTVLLTVPLLEDVADPLREQLAAGSGGVVTDAGTQLTLGPLSVLVTEDRTDGGPDGFLVAGTVRPPVLRRAAAELARTTAFAVDDERSRR